MFCECVQTESHRELEGCKMHKDKQRVNETKQQNKKNTHSDKDGYIKTGNVASREGLKLS